MARHKDPVVEEVRRVRREISRRLMKAHRAGCLHEEILAVEREGQKASRAMKNGSTRERKHNK